MGKVLSTNLDGTWKNLMAKLAIKKKDNDVILIHSDGIKQKKLDLVKNVQEKKEFEKSMDHLYLFGREICFNLNIDCLFLSEKRDVVHKLEAKGIEKQIEYFTTTINLVEQTMCVMPAMFQCPKDWNECVQNKKFVIINGQHSIMTSKEICLDEYNKDLELKAKLQTWKCYVIWRDVEHELNNLSSKFNEPNLLGHWTSSLPKTIDHCRELWIENRRLQRIQKNMVPNSSEKKLQKKVWNIFVSSYKGAFNPILDGQKKTLKS
uniref:Predicted protein n=1 Tax=Physcomitrium patens TaxID=3218 RepID=A9U5H9_PHYPA